MSFEFRLSIMTLSKPVLLFSGEESDDGDDAAAAALAPGTGEITDRNRDLVSLSSECMHAPLTSAPFLRSSFTHSGLSEMHAYEQEKPNEL